jgi:ParB family chromosome partitioning protein
MALGRGLGEILSEVEEAYEKEDLSSIESAELEAQGGRIEHLPVKKISPNPFQPRKHFDEAALKELSQSIKEHGLLQPIVVIEKGDGFLLIAGERRLRAHKIAKITTIKAIIATVEIDEARLRELALIENIQRENLNAIELANSYAELIDVHKITHEELSSLVHKSRSQITNTMRLLSLSGYAQQKVASGKISQGHAKVLVGLGEKQQKIIIDSIIGQKLSVREAEQMVKTYKNGYRSSSAATPSKTLLDPYRKDLEKLLPIPHRIKANRIEISFSNEKDIENFLTFLKKG